MCKMFERVSASQAFLLFISSSALFSRHSLGCCSIVCHISEKEKFNFTLQLSRAKKVFFLSLKVQFRPKLQIQGFKNVNFTLQLWRAKNFFHRYVCSLLHKSEERAFLGTRVRQKFANRQRYEAKMKAIELLLDITCDSVFIFVRDVFFIHSSVVLGGEHYNNKFAS